MLLVVKVDLVKRENLDRKIWTAEFVNRSKKQTQNTFHCDSLPEATAEKSMTQNHIRHLLSFRGSVTAVIWPF